MLSKRELSGKARDIAQQMAMSLRGDVFNEPRHLLQLVTGLSPSLVEPLEELGLPTGCISLMDYPLLSCFVQCTSGRLGGLSSFFPLPLTNQLVRSLDIGSSLRTIDLVTQSSFVRLSQSLLC